MSAYTILQQELRRNPRTWLVTGAAGFIGSNLVEALLEVDQKVWGLDNFSTGKKENLEQIRRITSVSAWKRFQFIEGDIRAFETCRMVCEGVDFVLHQAALGSVPRSIETPLRTHENNVNGFLNMLLAARDANVKRFVYASSSAVYGDEPVLPKTEDRIGKPLSPYAATKAVNESYAHAFAAAYRTESIGLRYFNVFGPRQDPNGAYAAVIPRWIAAMLKGEIIFINGDGETSRDFSYVANVIQANLLSAATSNPNALNQVYNIAIGSRTTLNQLFEIIQDGLMTEGALVRASSASYRNFRAGDIQHSLADVSKAKELLGYSPTHDVRQGLGLALRWYIDRLATESGTRRSLTQETVIGAIPAR